MPEDDLFAPLKQYLADDNDQRKRYQLACHLADLYDQYPVYRADWLKDWKTGFADRTNSAMPRASRRHCRRSKPGRRSFGGKFKRTCLSNSAVSAGPACIGVF